MPKIYSILVGREIDIDDAEWARRQAQHAATEAANALPPGATTLDDLQEQLHSLQAAFDRVSALHAAPPAPKSTAPETAVIPDTEHDVLVVERDLNGRARRLRITPRA